MAIRSHHAPRADPEYGVDRVVTQHGVPRHAAESGQRSVAENIAEGITRSVRAERASVAREEISLECYGRLG